MEITKLGLCVALAGVMSLGAAFGADVQAAEYKLKVETKSLYESALTGVDGKTVIIKHFTVPPGFVSAKHFHPGDVFVYVLEVGVPSDLAMIRSSNSLFWKTTLP